jgi:hypothetical protein
MPPPGRYFRSGRLVFMPSGKYQDWLAGLDPHHEKSLDVKFGLISIPIEYS